ncbi:Dolichol-phosphate mannose synthase subunit 3, partial [Cucurbita argyrosperma subsp. argyrosperma]
MKHIVKILTLLMAISALWIGLLQTSILPHGHAWLLPIYFIVSLGCYGLLMVGVGLMTFPTCPREGLLLQQTSPSSAFSPVDQISICLIRAKNTKPISKRIFLLDSLRKFLTELATLSLIYVSISLYYNVYSDDFVIDVNDLKFDCFELPPSLALLYGLQENTFGWSKDGLSNSLTP